MIFPKPLKAGDTIGVIAPSSPPAKLTVDKYIESLEKYGFKVKIGKSIGQIHGFLSGTDQVRAMDFNNMFADPTIDGIICLRGGYGSARILPLIDWELPKKHPKFFMGFSDITALHVTLNQMANLITFHGPMVQSTFSKGLDDHTEKSFFSTMTMSETFDYINPPERQLECIAPGQAHGTLIGGNLSLLASTLGSPYEIDTENKILFIEDIAEATYRLDRMLNQLKLAGKLQSLSGVLIGDFNDCDPEKEGTQTLTDLIDDHFKPLNIPIIGNLGVGHCTPMSTLPLGAKCTMDANNLRITFKK